MSPRRRPSRRSPSRRGPRRFGLAGVLAFFAAAAALVAGGFWLYRGAPLPQGWRGDRAAARPRAAAPAPSRPADGPRRAPRAAPPAAGTARPAPGAGIPITEPEGATPYTPRAGEAPEPAAVAAGQARLALVIDDLGRDPGEVAALAALGVPLTYAVLPFEEHTAPVAAALRDRGEEILLHLPMEAAHGADPGPGALTRAMSDAELAAATRAALEAVPGATGVNNHMGSVLSGDERAMRAVLAVVGERRLFFLDSRTSPDTVAYRLARSLDLPAAERQVFLDPDPRPEAVRHQFHRLLDLARRRGSAVAIGHPHPTTLAVLGEQIPRARALGYEFVPVGFLLERGGEIE